VVFKVGTLGPAYWDWVDKPEPGQPRFFDSWLLESISKTPWWVVPLVWIPIFVAALARSVMLFQIGLLGLLGYIAAGVVAWQLLEYVIHRYVFHGAVSSYWGITFHFLFHGCHHKYPSDLLRLVFPPVPASALVALVWTVLHALLPQRHALPLFGGMGLGYVAYDCIHYTIHAAGADGASGALLKAGGPLLRAIRRRHLDHHFRDHSHDYGISSSLFDIVFGSLGTPAARARQRMPAAAGAASLTAAR
jgi:dihydroceramide fatty acyl 2-hydroxylase